MRELVKSMMSLALSSSLMGAKTLTRLASPKTSGEAVRDSDAFLKNLNRITQDALGPEMRKAFDYGDEIQRRVLDAGMGALGGNLMDPSQVMKIGHDGFELASKIFKLPQVDKGL